MARTVHYYANIDGSIVHVNASKKLSKETAEALTALVRAVKNKYPKRKEVSNG